MNRQNNFDLLRLFAASQVLYFHALEHLQLGSAASSAFNRIFSQFPGVPIFFVISGFLITASFLRNRTALLGYARNRILRIFPALIVCTLVTTGVLAYFGYASTNWRMGAWLLGQVTILPIYNPDFLRGFGVGDPNGALWTIPVEMQFYIFVPVFFGLWFAVFGEGVKKLLPALIFFIIGSFAIYTWYMGADRTPLLMQVFYISLLPHLWMFLLGSAAYVLWPYIRPMLEGKALAWAVAYGAFIALGAVSSLGVLGLFTQKVLLALLVLSAAFTLPKLAHMLLRRADVSYGLYLYHMPVINTFVELGKTGSWLFCVAAWGVSVCLAIASWFGVERPALQLKRKKTVFAPAEGLG